MDGRFSQLRFMDRTPVIEAQRWNYSVIFELTIGVCDFKRDRGLLRFFYFVILVVRALYIEFLM